MLPLPGLLSFNSGKKEPVPGEKCSPWVLATIVVKIGRLVCSKWDTNGINIPDWPSVGLVRLQVHFHEVKPHSVMKGVVQLDLNDVYMSVFNFHEFLKELLCGPLCPVSGILIKC